MKITLEADCEQNKNEIKTKVYENIYEFALVGTFLERKMVSRPINHSSGDKFALIGKLEELKMRLYALND